ncbi:hypothetical protein [Larkinella humicola]|uniref:Uncharacterized protein n=1 Tax=Larkinella humicola TaxID=2607654 RepID=A0A5N1JNL1_9BACT|nr:hypothetical protein [Larkinella humicola]KAA9355186.1 hypothetical protein F0P93_11455 [Larkinella humicola]
MIGAFKTKLMRFLVIFLPLVLLVWQCSQFGYHSIGGFPTRAAAHAKALEHLHFWYYWITTDMYKIEYSYLENGAYKREAMWYFKDENRLGLEEDIGSGFYVLWPGINRSEIKRLIVQTQQGMPLNSILRKSILPGDTRDIEDK